MSTIRRSSRRAAAKATGIDMSTTESQEKYLSTIPRDESILTSKVDPHGQNDTQIPPDTVRGRVIRRQSVTSSPTSNGEVDPIAGDVPTSKVTSNTSRKREATVSPDSSNSNNVLHDNDSNIDHDGKAKKSRKTVTFDGTTTHTTGNSESDSSKKFRSAAQLAREQRSLRRQATATDQEEVSEHHLVGITRTSSSTTSRNRKSDHRVNHKKKTNGSSVTSSDTADVVRVPMLTGTLVLYRGQHPRAVFIRRV